MNTRIASLLLAAAALSLAACKDSPDARGAGASRPAPTAVSIEAIEAQAKGFSVGSTMSRNVVYVFFDPQCPHCAALWQAAKPLKSQARFVWIPVGLINPSSTAQGATILTAPDPSAAMDEHEASLTAKRGGISAGPNIDASKPVIEKNTKLMDSFGFGSVPSIVARHAQTGALVKTEGSMPTNVLAQFLGLQAPGS